MKILLRAIALTIAWLSLTAPAAALDQKMINWCNGKNSATPQQIIQGCTAAINSKRIKGVDLANFFLNRGLGYSRIGNNERALKEYAQAEKLNPRFVLLYVNRSGVLGELGRHEEALADASKAIEINPRATLGYYNRGSIHIALANYEAAEVDLGRAVQIDPKFGAAYNNRALVRFKLKRFESAVADATMAIKLVPKGAPKIDHAIPRGTRSDAYFALKNYRAALADLDAAIALVVRPEYLRSRMTLHELLGTFELGLADAARLIELDAGDALAWNSRCWHEALSGKLEAALTSCNKSIELAPNRSYSLDSRGLVYLKMGRLDESIADYNAALKVAGYASDGKVTEAFAVHLYGRGLARQKKGDVLGSTVDLAAAKAAKSDLPELYAGYLKN